MVIDRLYLKNSTVGWLTTLGFQCATLELPWRDNKPEKSCIPEGIYPYRIAMSPSRGTEVIWIDNVPNRSAIQIHVGNFTSQILGCVLVGDGIKDINKDGVPDVMNSEATFKALMQHVPPHGLITIRASKMENAR